MPLKKRPWRRKSVRNKELELDGKRPKKPSNFGFNKQKQLDRRPLQNLKRSKQRNYPNNRLDCKPKPPKNKNSSTKCVNNGNKK